jgi:cytochrome c biogenesis protein CcmG, thiol:disulfide interchange protein DsbE
VNASRLRWAIPAAVVPVLLLLAYGFKTDPRGEIPSPLLGKPAAAFTLTTFTGTPVSLEGLRGKVVVLNFWASWCVPACYEEAPALERTWRDYQDKGVMVVGVDIQDKEEAARKFMAEFGYSFPNAPDPAGRVAISYGVYGVPETFFIDRKGRVRFKSVGVVTEQVARQRLDALLKEPS